MVDTTADRAMPTERFAIATFSVALIGCGQVVNVVDEMICVLFSPICGQEPDLSQLTLNRTINTANCAKHLLKLLLVLSKIKDSVAMLWL